ncbi:hypothetical protein TWF730_002583 [Orbilia blumenaviensis]|uniref:Uncharacterized protein n=1 Tax=Orbilia blumenaviensis TaxID=1796055 RepID=A0AAV9UAF8_9PEZI
MRFSTLVTALAAVNIAVSVPAVTTTAPSSPSTNIAMKYCLIRVEYISPGYSQRELVIGKALSVNTTSDEPERGPHRRYSTSCYTGPHWVLQDQINRAIGGICTYMRGHDDQASVRMPGFH